jgi:hypothetical protein
MYICLIQQCKGICKYLSFSKVGGNYPLDLKIIWSSGLYLDGIGFNNAKEIEELGFCYSIIGFT